MWEGSVMRSLTSRLAAACAAALALCAVLSASAFGAYGVQVTAEPADPTAGAHSDLTIRLAFTDPSRDLKDMDLHLPAGLLGDPHAADLCTVATFQSDAGCPAAAQVGTVSSTAAALGIPLLVEGEVYNLQPRGGEPALLGISLAAPLNLAAPIKLLSPISARAPGGDYGLDSAVRDVPNTAIGLGFLPLPIDVTNMSLTLWGSKAAHPTLKSSFLVNPTTCKPATTTANVTAYDGSKASGSSTFTPTHCDTIGFKPAVSMTPTSFTADQPAGVAAQVAFPDGDIGGRAQSQVRTARVVLPPGFVLSAGVAADGLEGCTDAQFAAKSDTDPACPSLSNLGTVSFVSPLLGELKGDVYLGMPTADVPMRLFAYARKGDVRVKLVGATVPDPSTGQLTTVFDDLPEQPFKTFTLTFRGGDTAALTTPQTCGDAGTVTGSFEPFSRPGTKANVQSAPVTVTDCAPPTFTPNVGASITPTQAGADSHAVINIVRPDRQPRLSSLSMQMPPGLLGHLASVPMCPIDQARAAACDPSTQVGTASTEAGTGPRTVALSGPIYLTSGFDGGVAGLAVVINAKVGPLDLGRVASITKLSLRPGDLAIRADTEPLPTILGGVPLAIRSLTLALDRDGFMLNPTSCAASTLDASFTAADGQTATAAAPLQATGCENLPFQPKVTAVLGAPLANPSLKMTVAVPAGNANVQSLAMALPKEVGANLKALSGACMAPQFATNTCPDSSIVGTATADSPLSPTPLSGPVRIVQSGSTLPDLVIDLSGFTNLRLTIHNSFPGGRLKSTIDGVPDVPLSSFVLDLKGGGLLQTVDVKKICSAKPTVEGEFVAHSGATAKVDAVASLPACAGAASASYRTTASLRGAGKGRTPTLSVKVRGSKLKSLRVTLPKQLRLDGKRLSRGGTVAQGGKRISRKTAAGRRALRHTKRTVTARTTKTSTGSIQIRLAKGALRKGKGLKVGKRVTLKLRVTNSAGKHKTITVRVKARK